MGIFPPIFTQIVSNLRAIVQWEFYHSILHKWCQILRLLQSENFATQFYTNSVKSQGFSGMRIQPLNFKKVVSNLKALVECQFCHSNLHRKCQILRLYQERGLTQSGVSRPARKPKALQLLFLVNPYFLARQLSCMVLLAGLETPPDCVRHLS